MKNSDMPAMPITSEPYPAEAAPANVGTLMTGLTKREMFAMAAMQGLVACQDMTTAEDVARYAIMTADALLAELERTK